MINLKNIPEELQTLNHWARWEYEGELLPFSEALPLYKGILQAKQGLGLWLNNTPYVAYKLHGGYNGHVLPWAATIIQSLGSYSEVFGNDIYILVKGKTAWRGFIHPHGGGAIEGVEFIPLRGFVIKGFSNVRELDLKPYEAGWFPLPTLRGSDPLEVLLARLSGVKKRSGGYMACCPAHEDRSASLSISQAADGTILMKCFAGCPTKEVLASIGLNFSNLYPNGSQPKEPYPKVVRSKSKPPIAPAPALYQERMEYHQQYLAKHGLPITLENRGLSVENALSLGLGSDRHGNAYIPLTDSIGHLLQIKMRLAKGEEKYSYLIKGQGSPCWYSKIDGPVLVVEGELNGMLCHLASGYSVIAGKEPNFGLLAKLQNPCFIFTDFDEAGNKLYQRWQEQAVALGIYPKRLGPLEEDLDACEYAHLYGQKALASKLESLMRG